MVAIAALLCLLAAAAGVTAQEIPVSFQHGVASGDPLSNNIILWTRVTPRELNETALATLTLPVKWVVSMSSSFSSIAASGQFTTSADRDFTVKVEAYGLKPGKSYYYKFAAGVITSPVGRFKLPQAPGKHQEQLRYAIFSCSNWGWGWFNAYDAATRYDLDAWIHLGDILYEYGVDQHPSPSQAVRFQEAPMGLQPATELLSLSDYRKRHALYRQDPGMQALSASAPLISAWDDHEVANDAWTDGAENHQPNEGSWQARKAAGVRAYHEWMPTRVDPRADVFAFYRSFQFGDLATLMMLETRLSARTNPVPGTLPDAFTAVGGLGYASKPPSEWNQQMETAIKDFKASGDAIRNQTDRTILGHQQLEWVRDTTRDSLAAGTAWQLYGQDTVMLDMYAPDLEKAIEQEKKTSRKAQWQAALTNLTDAGQSHTTTIYTKTPRWSYLQGVTIPVTATMKYAIRTIVALARFKVNFSYDSWMGYTAERSRFLEAVSGGAEDAGKTSKLNAVVYGGDSHNAWAGVQKVEGSVVATEFDGPGVTSPGFEDYFPFIPNDLLAAGMLANNEDMAYSNLEDKGFMVVTLTHKTHRLQMMKVSTVGSMKYELSCDAAFTVAAGTKALKRTECQSAPKGTPYASMVSMTGSLGRTSSALP